MRIAILYLLVKITLSCVCPQNNDMSLVDFSKISLIPNSNEVINGIDYGKPVIVEGYVFLNKKFNLISRNTTIINECPTGYRVAEHSEILKFGSSQANLLIFNTTYKLNFSEVIYSSTKEFPDKLDSSDPDGYSFQTFYFRAGILKSRLANSLIADLSKSYYLCSADQSKMLKLNYYGYNTNTKYTLEPHSYLEKFVLRIDNVFTDRKSDVNFKTYGCHTIETWGITIGTISAKYNCQIIYVNPNFGSESPPKTINKLDPTSIKILKVDKSLGQLENFQFFNRGSASMAAIPTGGAYLFYIELLTDNGIVAKLDRKFNKISSSIVGLNYYPLDIVATEFGFIIYTKLKGNNDRSLIIGYNEDMSVRFNRTVMDNGSLPSLAKNQLMFYDENGKLLPGVNCMFANQGGKLSYSYHLKRLGLLFAHYNYFGMKSNKRNDHTGDTFITVDSDGLNENLGWAWGASHSLIQAQFYDGRHFVTASLGDLFPENIKVCFVDPTINISRIDGKRNEKITHKTYCNDSVIPTKLAGDGVGKSCGRMGGITKIGSKYFLVYSIKACILKSEFSGETVSTNDEIGMSVFEFDTNSFTIINIKNYKLGQGNNVIGLRSQRLGDKIVILLAITDNPSPLNNVDRSVYIKKDSALIMMVDDTGNVISSFDFPNFIVPVSDDMIVMNDGTLAWSVVDRITSELKVAYIPTNGKSLKMLR